MAYTMKEPIGVVAVISAFNHPFNLVVHRSAIAVGCPVIIRPQHKPMSALKLVELLKRLDYHKVGVQAVVCDRNGGELLVTSPKLHSYIYWFWSCWLVPKLKQVQELEVH